MSVWSEALDDAAAELGAARDSWLVERYATLKIALQLQRSKWAAGNVSGSADLLALMNEITSMRATAGLDVPREIAVRVVERLRGKCAHCGAMNEVPDEQVLAVVKATPKENNSNEPVTVSVAPDAPPGAPVPPPVQPVSAQRPGVSASRFHSQVINGHEVPPLKRQTSRLVSPMSIPTPTKG
jgi:hypothetical protein